LERWPAGWRLDRRESTRRSLKYRCGEGEILIVNHDGHGWWDPQSSAMGDVFDLVQHLDPSLNFGQVRKETPSAGWCRTDVSRRIAAVSLGRTRSPGCRPLEASAEDSAGIAGVVVPLRAASYSGFDPDGCG
jgi:hypothetical protein